MAGNLKYCISLLQDNEENIRKDAKQLLLKLCNNIIKNPKDSRYRKIRLANSLVSAKLLPASGAIECLFEAGFVESDDGFLLPIDASLVGVKTLYSILDDTCKPTCSQAELLAPKNCNGPTASLVQKSRAADATKYQKPENTFLLQLMAQFRSVLRYEDKSLQDKVRAILPLEKLQILAMEKLREIQREMKMKKMLDDVVFEDVLLAELLNWFKLKFFKWVDTLACHNCMGECYNDGSRVSHDPRISRIEIHRCKSCKCENKFPRYTDPEALLHSRRGRCGEWANCFTLICRYVGFDARLVYDETDHAWTEVWSVAHQRWIHADACENLMDRPLIYERGWGKRLSYILAFSRDEVQDVTWRYTRKSDQVMKRRKHCSEEALALFIRKLNEERQTSEGYSTARRKFVMKRSALELAEMLNAPAGSEKPGQDDENEQADYGGRTSGSLAWRISRGEIAPQSSMHESTQWFVPRGISNFRLTYDIVSDTYRTIDAACNKTLETRQKWQKGIERVKGAIFRKEEPDWKMVYLARSPDSESCTIIWTLALEDATNTCINSVKLQARSTTFNGATVEWQVEGLFHSEDNAKDMQKVRSVADCQNFDTEDFKGAIKISVSATLFGGKGDVAWQHAQLFRQSLNECTDQEPSLLIQVDLVDRALA